jgi:hypothetical protein
MRRLLGKAVIRSGMSVVLLLAGAAGVLAYFTTTGAGTASGGVTVLAAPTISSATPGAGTVALSWSAVSAPGSGTVSYYVSRDGGVPEGNCPSSASTSTVTSCTDAGVSVATHNYTVTAVWRSWTATSTTVSAQVKFGPATHFLLTAATTTPTAGVADNLTITAKDEGNNTVATYTGLHNLTFGGASSIGAFTPTVSSSTGVVTNFGAVTAITFTNGVATVAGSNNGVMKLYKAATCRSSWSCDPCRRAIPPRHRGAGTPGRRRAVPARRTARRPTANAAPAPSRSGCAAGRASCCTRSSGDRAGSRSCPG